MTKKHALITVLLAVLIIMGGVGLGYGLSRMAAAKHQAALARAFMPQPEKPADNRSLKEKAKQAGRYAEEQRPGKLNAFADLSGLAANSSVIIVGIPEDNLSALSSDGRSITIDYKVQVAYVYKGALREGDTINVSLPGGKVAFEDGSTAEIRTPWFRKMMNGKAYVLFLNQSTPRADRFVTTGEAQGLFEIPTTPQESRTVRPSTGLPNDSMSKYSTMNVKDFFRELRKVTNKPLKSKA
jgi:hypothetical protein